MTATPKKSLTSPRTVSEAADLLGIHVNTMKRISPHDLPYFTVGTGMRDDRRYRLEDIERYIERRMVR